MQDVLSVNAMNFLNTAAAALAFVVFIGIWSNNVYFGVKKSTRQVVNQTEGSVYLVQNDEKRSGGSREHNSSGDENGDYGDNEDFKPKRPPKFPFFLFAAKDLAFHSAMLAAENEVLDYASSMSPLGQCKDLEEHNLVIADAAIRGQFRVKVRCLSKCSRIILIYVVTNKIFGENRIASYSKMLVVTFEIYDCPALAWSERGNEQTMVNRMGILSGLLKAE